MMNATVLYEREFRLKVLSYLLSSYEFLKEEKDTVMKYLFILQEIECVPLGYRFSLYPYGPTDEEIIKDLSYLEIIRKISKTFKPENYWDNKINSSIREYLSEDVKESVKRVVYNFHIGKEELITQSIILYLNKIYEKTGRRENSKDLITKVSEVNPNLDFTSIKEAIRRLQKLGYLNVDITQ